MRINLVLFLLIIFCGTSFAQDHPKDGIFKKKFPNGMRDETTYKHGKMDGPYRSYWKNGNLRLEINYKNDKADGIIRIYHDNGNIAQEHGKKNGKDDGIWNYYDDNGKLIAQNAYKDGLLLGKDGQPFNGTHKQYFDYGWWQEDNYVNGQIDGVSKLYNKAGKPSVEKKYVKGKVVAFRAVDLKAKASQKWTSLDTDKAKMKNTSAQ